MPPIDAMGFISDDKPLVLRGLSRWDRPQAPACDVALARGRVHEVGRPSLLDSREVELAGRVLLPGLVNAHDHLDLSPFPPLGAPPYANLYDWTDAVAEAYGELRDALHVPLVDRLFLGGLRNLLAGVTAVAHHGPYHRSLGRADFPLRVLERYQFAHSPRLTPSLRKLYRSSDRRIPWFVHAGEGTDAESRGELELLAAANVLRQNTVVVHGLAFGAADAARLAAARACVVWQPEAARRLYATGTDVASLRAAGVRLGLGSDSAAAGARDALSNLAAARREGVLSDTELLALATRGGGEVARLPVGALEPLAPADFVVVDALERFLEGERRAIALVVSAGRALYGTPELMAAAVRPALPLSVDGAERRLAAPLALRARSLFARHPAIRRAAWAAGLEWPH